MSEMTTKWTIKFKCGTKQDPSMGLFLATSTIVCFLPIVFYVACYFNTQRATENLLQENNQNGMCDLFLQATKWLFCIVSLIHIYICLHRKEPTPPLQSDQISVASNTSKLNNLDVESDDQRRAALDERNVPSTSGAANLIKLDDDGATSNTRNSYINDLLLLN